MMLKLNLLAARFKDVWKKWESLAPQILLAFIALVLITIFLPTLAPKATLACPPLGWLQNGFVTGDLFKPTFNWTWENNSFGGSGLHVNLYLWNCPARDSSCQSAFGSDTSGQPVTSMPYSMLNNGGGALWCNHTYYWYAYAGDSCTSAMFQENTYWTFTTPACPPQQHHECQNNACALVSGAGADTCQSDNDCKPQTHMECQNMGCVSVSGAGSNTCTSDTDCFHKICSNSACTKVAGSGQSNCSSDSDCVQQTHMTCQNNACVSVAGPGTNTCTNRNDCAHFTCQSNNTCGLVTGAGQDSCQTNNDCVPQTHLECRNQACVPVSGAGSNSCNSNNDCQTHRECRNQACTTVSGSGDNQCNVDGDCTVAQHRTCQNNACVTVSGAGATTCNTNSDCTTPSQQAFCDSIVVNPTSGNVPTTVAATLYGHTQNGGSISTYNFNFGDGTSTTTQPGSSMSHMYNNAGSYMISGIVTDNLGNQVGGSNCQRVVTVYQPQVLGVATPPAIPKTGPEDLVLVGMFGSGAAGWWLRKLKIW